MKKTWKLFIHLGYWSVYILIWLVVLLAINLGPTEQLDIGMSYPGIITGVAIVPSIFCFYIFYFWLFPHFLQKGQFVKCFLLGILVALSSFLIAALTLRCTANMGFGCYGQSNYIAIPLVGFISFLNGCVALIIRGFITWFEDSKIKEALLQKNHKMELELIKARLDPHFLFNTLNNIDILIIKDAEKASSYLKELSDIMRFMLFETKVTSIPLYKELDYIRKYVRLQKIRTSNDAYVTLNINGEEKNKSIAPFVFIPFIENAFKHSQNKKLKDAIKINFDINENYIRMHCENKWSNNTNDKVMRNGIGNDLITKRLNLLYPQKHRLKIDKYENKYVVSLKVEHEKN